MEDKTTSDLTQELMSQDNLDDYIQDNRPYFFNQSVAQLLDELYQRKAVSKAALARQAGMSEVYLHQVFSGRRNPSRDRLLCLCIGLDATLEETQTLLKRACHAQLYPRLKRDAIICHGLIHHVPLSEVNDKLFAENEKTLY